MRKIALVMAALMLSGCGKVEGFSRRDGAEHNAETISEVTTTTTIKATKTSEITTTNIKEETTTTKKGISKE